MFGRCSSPARTRRAQPCRGTGSPPALARESVDWRAGIVAR